MPAAQGEHSIGELVITWYRTLLRQRCEEGSFHWVPGNHNGLITRIIFVLRWLVRYEWRKGHDLIRLWLFHNALVNIMMNRQVSEGAGPSKATKPIQEVILNRGIAGCCSTLTIHVDKADPLYCRQLPKFANVHLDMQSWDSIIRTARSVCCKVGMQTREVTLCSPSCQSFNGVLGGGGSWLGGWLRLAMAAVTEEMCRTPRSCTSCYMTWPSVCVTWM